MRKTAPGNRGEHGQIIVMVAMAAIMLFGIVGLGVDLGRMYIMKAELSRAVDSAALSGVLEFNGTPAGLTAAQTKAQNYLGYNEPTATATINADGTQNMLTVSASKSINMYFLSVFGVGSASVSARAVAGFGTLTVDAVLVLDATGSMAGSPIDNAKTASINFKNILLGSAPSGNVAVGATPFRGCFRAATETAIAPRANTQTNCVNYTNETTYLTTNTATLTTRINAITAVGGSGTNPCGGLYMGKAILDGPGNHTAEDDNRRYLVFLSDGDTTYNNYSYDNNATPSPYPSCRPTTTPATSDTDLGTACAAAQTREREVDIRTWTLAKQMEAEGIEIFVVGFGVCDPNNTGTLGSASNPLYTQAQCDAQIGNSDHDNTADERLNKCMASSKAGTNDHYFYASSASALPTIFTSIAQQIAHRLVE